MAVRFSTDRASFLLSALARSRVFGALVVTREGAGKGQESLESERDMTAPLLLLLPSFLLLTSQALLSHPVALTQVHTAE